MAVPVKAQTEKKQRNPPADKYHKVDLGLVERLASLGLTDAEIGKAIGLCQQTIRNYKKKPDFKVAIEKGKEVADRKVELSLYKRALGFEYNEVTKRPNLKTGKLEISKVVTQMVVPDTVACIFWLKNRKRDEWRDKQDHEHTGTFILRYGHRKKKDD